MDRLDRTTWPRAPLPTRMVHIGPGRFFRAHPAWYTARAGGWGAAAVAPRDAGSVADLAAQDGLYAVLTRGPDGDRTEIIDAVTETAGPADLGSLLSREEVSVVTLTVTEAGYRNGSPVVNLLAGALSARVEAAPSPLAVVSCDNLAANGPLLRTLVMAAASNDVRDWIASGAASFPSTVVDRITPAATEADLGTVALEVGLVDRAAVVTEPYSEWIFEDDFPGGRPDWHLAGARPVDDARPWAERKLRLLNAGHSMLAYLGGARGHRFVHEAMADAEVLDAVRALWSEAIPHVEARGLVGVDAWLAETEARWTNPRLPHALAQIATDGSTKLAQRARPNLLAGGVSASPATVLLFGAWIAYLRGSTPFSPADVDMDRLEGGRSVPIALGVVDYALGKDRELVRAVEAAAQSLSR